MLMLATANKATCSPKHVLGVVRGGVRILGILTSASVQNSGDLDDTSSLSRRRESRARCYGSSTSTSATGCTGTEALKTVVRRRARTGTAATRARGGRGGPGGGGQGRTTGGSRRWCRRGCAASCREGT